MSIPDWFQTIAEVAIGLAGFSSLVVALRRDAGPLSNIQKFRMSVLFGMAFGAMFLSFTPWLLSASGVSPDFVWKIAALTMITWSVGFMYFWMSRSRRVAQSTPEIFNWRAFSTMTAGHIVNLVLQFSIVLSWFTDTAPGIFGCGLVWYLMHGSQQFVRMLFVQPRDEHE